MKPLNYLTCLILFLLFTACNDPAPATAKEKQRGGKKESQEQQISELQQQIIGGGDEDTTSLGNFPEPDGYVTDIADVLTDAEEEKLEKRLKKYEEQTTREIAIAIVQNIGNYERIDLYSTDLANTWGIGKAGKDNDLLITIAMEIREIRIDYGKGTAEDLTDQFAQKVIGEHMRPKMKEEAYNDAIKAALDAIMDEWD